MTEPPLLPLDDGPGPARPLSPGETTALVRAALGQLLSGEGAHRPRRLRGLWVAGAVLLVAGAAVASATLGKRPPARPPVVAPAPPRPLPPVPAPPPARPPRRLAVRTLRSPRVLPPAPEERPSVPDRQLPAVVDELARANELRAQRRYGEAADVYAAVQARTWHSQEGYVATLARADLLLERLGRPAEALGLYVDALAVAGPLRQEALYGVAGCHRALGHRVAERKALRTFLAEFPDNPLRGAAEARLRELE